MYKELFDWIKSLLTERKDVLFSVLILAALVFTCVALYDRVGEERTIAVSDREAVKTQCQEDIRKLREYQIQAEIQFQEDLAACRRECRMKIDSIEQSYYQRFSDLHRAVKRLGQKVNTIIE